VLTAAVQIPATTRVLIEELDARWHRAAKSLELAALPARSKAANRALFRPVFRQNDTTHARSVFLNRVDKSLTVLEMQPIIRTAVESYLDW
jgi:hypothetical protein